LRLKGNAKRRKYCKSVENHRAKQQRLKRVLFLQDNGFTVEKIALTLGVSPRTVKRDLAKAKPTLARRQKLQLCILRDKDWQTFLSGYEVRL
jgi:transcriptional antiterminator